MSRWMIGSLISMLIIAVSIPLFIILSQQTILGEDWFLYDDFLIPSLALADCGENSGSLECVDSKWRFTDTFPDGCPVPSYNDGSYRVTTGDCRGYGVDLRLEEDFKGRYLRFNGRVVLVENSLKFEYQQAKITFEGVEVNLESNGGVGMSKNFLFEIVPDVLNPEIVTIYLDGGMVKTITIPSPYHPKLVLKAGGDRNFVELQEVRYKPLYSCEVENDEVVIRDVFTEGSIVTINELTYPPVKFCLDSYPAVLRSFTEEGVATDLQGKITRQLAGGESVTVPLDSTLAIHYIADFREGQVLRCGVDEAYDIKSGVCVKVVSEAPDIVEVVRDIILVEVGGREKVVESRVVIGDYSLTAGIPSFSCRNEVMGNVMIPNPKSDCWSTVYTSSLGSNMVLEPFGMGVIDKYFGIESLPSGRYDYTLDSVEVDSLSNKFKFGIVDDSFLTITQPSFNMDTDYFKLLKSGEKLSFNIDNKLTNLPDSGVRVNVVKDLVDGEESFLTSISFDKGSQTYSIPIDTSQLGIISYEITPYYTVNGDKFFHTRGIVVNYEIVQEIPENVDFSIEPASEELLDVRTGFGLAIILIILIVFTIFVFVANKNYRKKG